jgi:hypothetical protein
MKQKISKNSMIAKLFRDLELNNDRLEQAINKKDVTTLINVIEKKDGILKLLYDLVDSSTRIFPTWNETIEKSKTLNEKADPMLKNERSKIRTTLLKIKKNKDFIKNYSANSID